MRTEYINLIENQFSDADSARRYLEKRRWPHGPTCPYCESAQRIQIRKDKGYYRCLECTHVFTVRTGTIMSRSHISLEKWLHATFLVLKSDKKISSTQLSKQIGSTQKSAWHMLQKLHGVI